MLGTDNYVVSNNDINKIDNDFKKISLDKVKDIIPTEPEAEDENVVLTVSCVKEFRLT